MWKWIKRVAVSGLVLLAVLAAVGGLWWYDLDLDLASQPANLLLNAVQHGGEGVIVLEAGDGGLVSSIAWCRAAASGCRSSTSPASRVLRNPPQAPDGVAGASGFGLGPGIVQRLAERIGRVKATTTQADGTRCEVHWPGTRAAE